MCILNRTPANRFYIDNQQVEPREFFRRLLLDKLAGGECRWTFVHGPDGAEEYRRIDPAASRP